MKTCVIVAVIMLGTTAVSGLFWRFVMPRLARKEIRRVSGAGLVVLFGLALVGIPLAGYWWMPERNLATAGVVTIAWCLAARASAWFAARKYFVPALLKPPRL